MRHERAIQADAEMDRRGMEALVTAIDLALEPSDDDPDDTCPTCGQQVRLIQRARRYHGLEEAQPEVWACPCGDTEVVL